MSATTEKAGLTGEEAVYVRVLDELFVRLSLHAADTSSGRALLYRLREEVVEHALQEVRADGPYGGMLVGISNYLLKVVHVECDERERRETLHRTHQNVETFERQ